MRDDDSWFSSHCEMHGLMVDSFVLENAINVPFPKGNLYSDKYFISGV